MGEANRRQGVVLAFSRTGTTIKSGPDRPLVTLHLATPISWQGQVIADIPLRGPDSGKAALHRVLADEDGDLAFGSVAAAVAMSGYPAEMLQVLGDKDSARLLFVSMALINYGDR